MTAVLACWDSVTGLTKLDVATTMRSAVIWRLGVVAGRRATAILRSPTIARSTSSGLYLELTG